MNSRFPSRMRLGLIALGLIAGLTAPAAAAPLAGIARAAVAPAAGNASSDLVQVTYRSNCYRYGNCRRYGNWNNNWNNNYWNGDDWRYRKYRRHHRRNLYVQPRFYLGVPAYRYVQPRRYYRGGGSAHVAWCYYRYRSYRAWDNTYQPYHGPRRQCWSPFS